MTEFETETIRKLREHANQEENYNAGWDTIAEAHTDSELLELFCGDTDESWATMVEIFGEEIDRQPPADTYEEAFRRVESVVKVLEEQRRAVLNEIW